VEKKSKGLSDGSAVAVLRKRSQVLSVSWMCHSDNLDADGRTYDDSNLWNCSL